MTGQAMAAPAKAATSSTRLMILLAAAIFVLVVDTSLMNVSISAVVHDLGTTVSGVQSAIALEALVSAAFILISSKIGDLIGRKRAYTIGLIAYAIGALAMTLTQTLLPVIIFWAIFGGLGASLLLPAMQALISGNFDGPDKARAYAMVGAAAGIAAAVGPLLGGFITTYATWRLGFALEVVIIIVVLIGLRLIKDAPFTGERGIDVVGAILSVVAMGGTVLGILIWQEGGEFVLAFLAVGLIAFATLAWWLLRREKAGQLPLIDPKLFQSKNYQSGVIGQLLQQVTLGGTMIALPIFLQMVLEYNAMQSGLSIAPLSLSMFAVALLSGRRLGAQRPAAIIRLGFLLTSVGMIAILPLVPRVDSGLWLTIPLIVAGSGLGLLVSQLNNYTLAPISGDRISEAAGVNSAAGNFGLSFGLALAGALMLGTLSITFTNMANASTVLPEDQKAHVAQVLNEDAELMSNAALQAQLAGQPQEIQDEIIRINTEARPIALQVALLVPVLAGVLGFLNSLRMIRLPDIKPSANLEEFALGG